MHLGSDLVSANNDRIPNTRITVRPTNTDAACRADGASECNHEGDGGAGEGRGPGGGRQAGGSICSCQSPQVAQESGSLLLIGQQTCWSLYLISGVSPHRPSERPCFGHLQTQKSDTDVP